jgi:hypothetical protein
MKHNQGRGIWLPEKQEIERAMMRLRHNKKTQGLLAKALRRLERTEKLISELPEPKS